LCGSNERRIRRTGHMPRRLAHTHRCRMVHAGNVYCPWLCMRQRRLGLRTGCEPPITVYVEWRQFYRVLCAHCGSAGKRRKRLRPERPYDRQLRLLLRGGMFRGPAAVWTRHGFHLPNGAGRPCSAWLPGSLHQRLMRPCGDPLSAGGGALFHLWSYLRIFSGEYPCSQSRGNPNFIFLGNRMKSQLICPDRVYILCAELQQIPSPYGDGRQVVL